MIIIATTGGNLIGSCGKMRDDLTNRRINYDRHLAKLFANETGAIVIEKLNIKNMIKYVRWLKAFNRNLHYAGMGKMAQYIINAGGKCWNQNYTNTASLYQHYLL